MIDSEDLSLTNGLLITSKNPSSTKKLLILLS